MFNTTFSSNTYCLISFENIVAVSRVSWPPSSETKRGAGTMIRITVATKRKGYQACVNEESTEINRKTLVIETSKKINET